MNRTLLLILCDFLLMNLLVVYNLSDHGLEAYGNKSADETEAREYAAVASEAQTRDLAEMMQLALEEERALRRQLEQQLGNTQTSLQSNAREVAELATEKERLARQLQQKQQTTSSLQSELEKLSTQARQTQAERDALARQRKELEQQLDMTRFEKMQREEALARDLAQREAELKAQEERARKIQENLGKLESQRMKSQQQLQQMQVAVEVAEVEKRMLRENLTARMQRELELKEDEARRKEEELGKLRNQAEEARKLMDSLALAAKKAEVENQLLRENLNEQKVEKQKEAGEKEKALKELEEQRLAAQQLVESLNVAVRTAETEKSLLRDNLSEMKEEKLHLQQQTTRLSESFTQLARNSKAIDKNVGQIAKQSEAVAREVGTLSEKTDVVAQDVQALNQKSSAISREVGELAMKSDTVATNVASLNAKSDTIKKDVGKLSEKSETMAKEVNTLSQRSGELKQGVTEIAKKSDEIAQEMRENRPMNLNILFTDFRSNRVETAITAVRKGLFNSNVDKSTSVSTVLIDTGRRTFALLHIEDTPFKLADRGFGTDWHRIDGSLSHERTQLDFGGFSFLAADPRVLLVPVTDEQKQKLDAKAYPTTQNPFKFEEAVLISKDGNYYGEMPFRVDPSAPQYVRVESRFFRRIFGTEDFSPSTGDLVFSKTGELLGMMVNRKYCVVLNNFRTARNLDFLDNLESVKTSRKFEEMYFRLQFLPQEVR